MILMEAANQVAAYIIFDHSSQSYGSIYSGTPSLTYTICRSKDLEWGLFCFSETFFKTNTTIDIYSFNTLTWKTKNALSMKFQLFVSRC